MLKAFGKKPSGKRLERIQKSPYFKNGSFANLEHTPVMAKGVSYLSLMKDFFSKGVDREPFIKLPSVKTDLKVFSSDKPAIIWFGHSSYLIYIEGKKILVDPVFSAYASPFQFVGVKNFEGTSIYTVDDLPEIDALILTHDHYDHLDYPTMLKLKSKVKKVFAALGVGSHLEYWGFDTRILQEFEWWQKEKMFEGMDLIAAPSRHFSGRGFIRNKTLWTSFILKTTDHTLFIGGDSGYDNTFKIIGDTFGPFDIALVECGQYNVKWPYIHMMPEQTVQAGIDLKAKVLMPVHWGKFKLALHPWKEPIERAVLEAERLNIQITTPRIGEPVIVKSENLPQAQWWKV